MRSDMDAIVTSTEDPAVLWENGYDESFQSQFGDECLAVVAFGGPHDARAITAAWRADFKHHRPLGSLDIRPRADLPPCVRLSGWTNSLISPWYRKSNPVRVTHPVATRAAHLRINWIADHPTWWPWARWFRRIRISCRHPPSRSLVTSWERHSPNDANSQGLVGTLGPE